MAISEGWILVLALSFMLNVMVIGFALVTGVGWDALKRFFNKIRYKTGRYTNTLFYDKSGNIKEVFSKNTAEGGFKINDKTYTRSPRLLRMFRGIPTYVHLEDEPEPKDMFKEYQDTESISTSEVDQVMSAKDESELLRMIKQYAPFVMIGAVVVVIGVLGVGYLVYQGNADILAELSRVGGQVANNVDITPR